MRWGFLFFVTISAGCNLPESAQSESSAGGSGGASQSGGCEPMPGDCVANPPTPEPPCAMAYPDLSTRPWVCDDGATLDECLPTGISVACPGEPDKSLWCCP